MIITKIDVMQVHKEPTSLIPWRPVLCRIYTDEGIYGDGEAAVAYISGAPAAFGMVKDLAAMLIGLDPLDNEKIWEIMYKRTFWGQNGGPIIFAGMSAIDIALWDIKGKYFDVPVYKLLGGKKRDKLRTYASQLQFGWGEGITPAITPEDYYNNTKKAMAEGYDCVKVDFFTFREDGKQFDEEDRTGLLKPYYVKLVESRVAAVREAAGENVDIIMENHSFLDAQSAIQLGRVVQKYNIFYYEEPNTPNPKTAKYIRESLQMPIASGERIYSRWQYAPYFEDQSIQLIQPDLGNCGGITEGKKICDMAHVYDIGVQAHVCASPLSTAAALHLEAVIPNFVIHEHHVFNLSSWNKRLAVHDYQPVNGEYSIPELPGLGNEISEYAFANSEKVTVK
ncbi:mandelate racemase/muconate lactonizing enzyme family protein [Sporomusa acidovorans]|uniref:D-galactonate dehydratase n=1 Tax=Sporomusa acidovorans (strain ATCC 49682 / DSM 3132 / Mol) TaxID=1123286 RepID=A0ABZ3J7L5_SPOA4|nr:mandelate racemase/muconate lactonizing enzyme family protein [Sporomusa acidovorans]OZC18487.1 D-galactonate dehydratase [Sporomusa acidovorans DSM 3132]SDE36327.1 L-alanine-DL-glutamate epimerase [Sporomusa acidovorans]